MKITIYTIGPNARKEPVFELDIEPEVANVIRVSAEDR